MKKIFEVPYNIVRGVMRLIFRICVALVCFIIKLLAFEPNTSKEITVRKAKRIRMLSRFKVWVLNFFPDSVNRYLGIYNYKIYLNKHLRDGLQLCHK